MAQGSPSTSTNNPQPDRIEGTIFPPAREVPITFRLNNPLSIGTLHLWTLGMQKARINQLQSVQPSEHL